MTLDPNPEPETEVVCVGEATPWQVPNPDKVVCVVAT